MYAHIIHIAGDLSTVDDLRVVFWTALTKLTPLHQKWLTVESLPSRLVRREQCATKLWSASVSILDGNITLPSCWTERDQ